jgi:hypothetical protein
MVKLGYIYEIRSSNTDKCYIGSTFQQDLNKRLNQHKIHYKSYNSGKRGYITSFEVVKFNDAIINLLSINSLIDIIISNKLLKLNLLHKLLLIKNSCKLIILLIDIYKLYNS